MKEHEHPYWEGKKEKYWTNEKDPKQRIPLPVKDNLSARDAGIRAGAETPRGETSGFPYMHEHKDHPSYKIYREGVREGKKDQTEANRGTIESQLHKQAVRDLNKKK